MGLIGDDNMANKKLVTLEQLTKYTGKVKENLNKKLDKNGDQILAGSFTTTGDVSIQGNLHVAGSTIAVNKETLTVKDNFVAVNGNGTVLDTTKKVGLLAITGEETYKLKDGWYRFNAEAIYNKLNPQVGGRPNEPEMLIISSYDRDFLSAVNLCGLCARLIKYNGEVKA
jgi:hypothetical protein